MAAPKSSESKKPQIESKPEAEASNVSGTKDVLKVTGQGSKIQAEGAVFNMGCGAGNPRMSASQNVGGCSGTTDSIKAESGGELLLKGAMFNTGAGAGAGSGIPQDITQESRTVGHAGYGDTHDVGSWAFSLLFRQLMAFFIGAVLQLLGLNNRAPKGKQ